MSDENSPEERLSKFSNAGSSTYRLRLAEHLEQGRADKRSSEENPLAGMIEDVIRDGAIRADPNRDPGAAEVPFPWRSETQDAEPVPRKLIDELQAAQEQGWVEPLDVDWTNVDAPSETALVAPDGMGEARRKRLTFVRVRGLYRATALKIVQNERLRQALRAAGATLSANSRIALSKALRLSRRMGPRDWRRRYLAFISLVHRNLLDRRTEQLLFSKTPPLQVYHITETTAGPKKEFVYQGPIPRKALNWALSAVPSDLKRYAFVDFRAGQGRTLLLAARHNFEYVAGYAFDAGSGEALEMNLAQYPRSYMSCRDVRALRGDRDGVIIPHQPAVLFFPGSLSANHLEIILDNVAASCRLHPRPLYLIFDDAGRERGLSGLEVFEPVPLSLVNRAKAFLFSPARVTVYRALNHASAASPSS